MLDTIINGYSFQVQPEHGNNIYLEKVDKNAHDIVVSIIKYIELCRENSIQYLTIEGRHLPTYIKIAEKYFKNDNWILDEVHHEVDDAGVLRICLSLAK